MAENTKIAWATHTFNPWIGCSKVHTGCQNCYAEAQSGRFGVSWGRNGTRRKTSKSYWRRPLAWNRKSVDRPRIFPSLCDPFEDWPHPMQHHRGPQLTTTGKGDYYQGTVGTLDSLRLATMDDLRRDFFHLIDKTPNLDYLLLTKRPENIRRMWPMVEEPILPDVDPGKWYRDNCWLIYSASDQETLVSGIDHLLACSILSPVIGLSLEPLLGPVDLTQYLKVRPTLDFVIVGGESGHHARPCNVEWIRSIVEQCKTAGVPCFVKQDSGPNPGMQGRIPEDLWAVKEFPRR